MSKDIWHTADVKPKSLKTFVYKTDKGHIGTSKLPIDSGWNPVLLPEFYSMSDFEVAERITKWCYLDDLLALETELTKCKKQVKKLCKQNRTLTESLGEYFNKWIDANIQALKNKDQIRHLTEQEQARHQLIIDQIKGLK